MLRAGGNNVRLGIGALLGVLCLSTLFMLVFLAFAVGPSEALAGTGDGGEPSASRDAEKPAGGTGVETPDGSVGPGDEGDGDPDPEGGDVGGQDGSNGESVPSGEGDPSESGVPSGGSDGSGDAPSSGSSAPSSGSSGSDVSPSSSSEPPPPQRIEEATVWFTRDGKEVGPPFHVGEKGVMVHFDTDDVDPSAVELKARCIGGVTVAVVKPGGEMEFKKKGTFWIEAWLDGNSEWESDDEYEVEEASGSSSGNSSKSSERSEKGPGRSSNAGLGNGGGDTWDGGAAVGVEDVSMSASSGGVSKESSQTSGAAPQRTVYTVSFVDSANQSAPVSRAHVGGIGGGDGEINLEPLMAAFAVIAALDLALLGAFVIGVRRARPRGRWDS